MPESFIGLVTGCITAGVEEHTLRFTATGLYAQANLTDFVVLGLEDLKLYNSEDFRRRLRGSEVFQDEEQEEEEQGFVLLMSHDNESWRDGQSIHPELRPRRSPLGRHIHRGIHHRHHRVLLFIYHYPPLKDARTDYRNPGADSHASEMRTRAVTPQKLTMQTETSSTHLSPLPPRAAVANSGPTQAAVRMPTPPPTLTHPHPQPPSSQMQLPLTHHWLPFKRKAAYV